VKAKYESMWGVWCSIAVYGSYRLGVLIRWGWGVFSKFVRFWVGDRSKIRFWHDE
jgi:hypothetical protein